MTENELHRVLLESSQIREVLKVAQTLQLPDWYLGAGAICQTVWNFRHHFEPTQFIKDFDLVYFAKDSGFDEASMTAAQRLFQHLSISVDLTNQAHVHRWYGQEFGFEIEPYSSTEEAIQTWPTTASAIGVRIDLDGSFKVYAPFGLGDLSEMIVRPNKKMINREIYESKATRWKKSWPELTVVEW